MSIEELASKLNDYAPEEMKISIDRTDFRIAVPYIDITIRISLDELKEEKWRIHLIGYLNSYKRNIKII